MFQITQNRMEHGVNLKGLHKVNGLKPPSNVRGYHVPVTPKWIQLKIIVCMEGFEGQQMHLHGTSGISVHCP